MRGAVAVELALIALPIVLMSVAAVEYSRLIFTYQILLKSVREGARYLSTFDPGSTGYASGSPNARLVAKNRVVYGNNAGTGAPIVVGLTPARVCIYDRANLAPAGCPSQALAKFENVSTGAGTPSMNVVRVEIRGYVFTSVFPVSLGAVNFEPIGVEMVQP
jgi:Flp pilus assembly protein TadG